MKTHAIIPIFISHLGCNNECVFCNQKLITARQKPTTPKEVGKIINEHLATLKNRNLKTIEVAFYGGSFTGLTLEEQEAYLKIAKKYKDDGHINKIHLSTRPDYIDIDILDLLKKYSVDIIELGVQSFDKEVLKASKRGHDSLQVQKAVKLIKSYGFEFGIQLMIGLPSDTYEKSIFSAQETVKLKPNLVRLYPTIVLEDTELMKLYKAGSYIPPSEGEVLKTCKDMYKILDIAGINIMRVGLKSTDIINSDTINETSYHPAFRQLVEGEIAKESIMEQIKQSNIKDKDLIMKSHPKSFSNLIGHKACNKNFFMKNVDCNKIKFLSDSKLKIGQYSIEIR